jgi:hypothetical protein
MKIARRPATRERPQNEWIEIPVPYRKRIGKSKISGTISVTLHLDTDHAPDSLDLKVACVPKTGNWSLDNFPEGTVELLPGETEIIDPDECIYNTGLIYIVIWNEGDGEILVNNLALELVAIAPDGSEVTYGYH